MKRLLARAGVERRAVAAWSPPAPGDARGRWRRRMINEALRPAEATADWLGADRAPARGGRGRRRRPDRRGPGGPVGDRRPRRGRGRHRRRPAAARGAGDARPHRRPDHPRRGAGAAGLGAGWRAGASWSTPRPARRWRGFRPASWPALVARAAADPDRPGRACWPSLKHPLVRLGLDAEAAGGAPARAGTLRPARPAAARRRPRSPAAGRRGRAQRGRWPPPGGRQALLDALAAALAIARAPFADGAAPRPSRPPAALAEALEALAARTRRRRSAACGPAPAARRWSALMAALIEEGERPAAG